MNDHAMLDDVAVYALGALPPAEAKRVRDHLANCALCQQEYEQLRASVSAIGVSAETSGNLENCPSTLLKPRIMRQVRADAAKAREPATPAAPARHGAPVWPAYLVAAACLAFAIFSSIANMSLTGQLKQSQSQVAQLAQHDSTLARKLSDQRAMLSDMLASGGKHYAIGGGEIVTRGNKLYIAMRDLPAAPRGKVYQAWTLAKGGKKVAPSLTFVPDVHGVAVLPLPVDARSLAAVAISVEPEGGSKQPTTKPIAIVPLT